MPNQIYDPLLECLIALATYYGRRASPNALVSNLPLVDNRLTPSLFIQAADRVNISAHLVERSLLDISEEVLPAVLILKDNNACVYTKRFDDGTGEFILPKEQGSSSIKRFKLSEIAERYLGIAIYTKLAYHFEKRADEYQVEKPASWFWDTILKFRQIYYNVFLASLLINLFALVTPLFVMNVYDRVVPNQTTQTLWALSVGIFIVYIFDLLMKVLRGFLLDLSGKKADIIISNALYRQLLEMQLQARPGSSGAFANAFHGFDAVRDFFTSVTLTALIDMPFVLLFIVVIAYLNPWIAILPLAAIPIVISASLFLEIPTRRAIERTFLGATQKHAILVESIERLETIKTSLSENEYLRKWEYFTSLVAKESMRSRLYSSVAINFSSFMSQIVYVAIIICGVYAIGNRNLTLGGLIAIAMLSTRTVVPLTQIATLITRYYQAKTGLDVLNKIMLLPKERSEKEYLHHPHLTGDIKFNDVSFNYAGQLNNVLHKVSFSIKPGEKVAIIGRIGSGKSTILKLIMGLYEPRSGNIMIDEIGLEQLDPSDLRRNIGYVGQDTGLFYGSLRDNIRKAASWASDDEIKKAAEISGVYQFSKTNPSGFDLMIGENGRGLSAGQQQAVAIARALISDPPILIFDDVSSEMDDTSESELQTNLKPVLKDKTLVLVTHKLSMLNLVDRIIVIKQGMVAADGPKEKVLELLGIQTVKA